MDAQLRRYLERLHEEGTAFDAGQADRRRRRRNLEPDSAQLLWILAVAAAARAVLEVGTSNGYSTLWLADAVKQTRGRVTSLDVDAAGQAEARRHLRTTGLEDRVTLRCEDAGGHLGGLPDGSVDLLFLDAERTEYPSWWPHPLRVLRPGGLLVVDNASSHADELAPFTALLAGADDLACQLVPVGKGVLVCCRWSTA